MDPDSGRIEPHPALTPDERHRAQETIRLCDLQRESLNVNRLEVLRSVQRWMHDNAAVRPRVDELDDLLSPTTQYKFVIRHAFRKLPEIAAEDRRRFEAPRLEV